MMKPCCRFARRGHQAHGGYLREHERKLACRRARRRRLASSRSAGDSAYVRCGRSPVFTILIESLRRRRSSHERRFGKIVHDNSFRTRSAKGSLLRLFRPSLRKGPVGMIGALAGDMSRSRSGYALVLAGFGWLGVAGCTSSSESAGTAGTGGVGGIAGTAGLGMGGTSTGGASTSGTSTGRTSTDGASTGGTSTGGAAGESNAGMGGAADYVCQPPGGTAGEGGAAGTSAELDCVVGQTYCFIRDGQPGTLPVFYELSCRSFATDGPAACASTPTCDCLCTKGGYHCQTECRCQEHDGFATMICDQI